MKTSLWVPINVGKMVVFSTLCRCTSILHIVHLKKEVQKTTFTPVKGISNVEIVFRDQNIFTSYGSDFRKEYYDHNIMNKRDGCVNFKNVIMLFLVAKQK